MFRTLVIMVEILLLVAVLRSPFVQYWFSDIQESLSDWMIEISLMGERDMLDKFKKQVLPNLGELKDYQKNYFNNLLTSKERLVDFNSKYCVKGDKNPFIQGAKLHYFCTTLGQSKILNPN